LDLNDVGWPDAQTSRPAPPKRYGTLLADPPWDLLQRGRLGAEQHYPLMSVAEICALRVEPLMADDAHAWVWVTNASIFAGRDVLEAWGFQYRSILTWVKPVFGLGQYLRTASEHVLLGTRGRAPILFRSQPSWLFAPRREHSHKPEEIYAVVERCSPGPYLELFARRRQPGWDTWGNEVSSDVTL
jgi:N6-adenosine-specific RNA methylase IME4